MARYGYHDSGVPRYPASINVEALRGQQTPNGVAWADILDAYDERLDAYNDSFDPDLARLMAPPTDEQIVESTGIGEFEVRRSPEYTNNRPQFESIGIAHRVPVDDWSNVLGVTERKLRTMTLEQIVRNVDSAINGQRKFLRRRAFRRLTDAAEWAVVEAQKLVGRSPGFAGSGTGDNVFSVTFPNGSALPAGYTLYYRDTAANLGAVLKDARDKLNRWIPGDKELIGPRSMIDLVMALPGFVKADSARLRTGSGETRALIDSTQYVGVYDEDILVRKPIEDWADPNLVLYHSGGALDASNALAFRYLPQVGPDAYVRQNNSSPLDNAILERVFDWGVNNRTAVANIRVDAAGPYVPPAIPNAS